MKSAHDLVVAARQSISEVSPSEVAALLRGKILLIDVREPGEFSGGHLPGAVNIPRGLLEFKLSENLESFQDGKPLVVYCKSGGRSALCAEALQRMELQGVLSMAGGFDAWAAEGLPVDSPPLPSFN